MTILGVILRTHPHQLAEVEAALRALPGVDVAAASTGRLVLVIEDSAERSAAARLGELALWPLVLGTSLVYEYSGPDSPSPAGDPNADIHDGADWRRSLVAAPAPTSAPVPV